MFARLAALPRPAWVIFAGMFVNKFGNFLSVFLVLYLTARDHSAFEAGLALGAAGLGSLLGNLVGGTVADRIGRRSVIVLSMAGSGFFTLLVPLADGFWPVVGLVTLVGIFAQLYRPGAGAVLVDLVPPEQRLTAFAVLRLAVNLGMAVGPMVGGLLAAQSHTWLFVGDALSSFLFAGLALALLPRDDRRSAPVPAVRPEGYRQVFADRRFLLFLGAMVAASFVYAQTTATLPLHVADAGFDGRFYGFLLGLNALVIVVFELPLTWLAQRFRATATMAVGIAVLGLGVALTGLAHGPAALIATVLLWTTAEMLYTPVANAHPGDLAPEHLRGRYQGADGMAHTLAAALGPVLGGFLYEQSPTANWAVTGAIGLAGAALILASAATRPRQAPATTPAPEPALTA